MQKKIHPKYYPDAKVHCACGAAFEVGSTQEHIETEICFQCHPFYTGKEKIIDTAGRIEKFKARKEKAAASVVRKKSEKKSGKKKN